MIHTLILQEQDYSSLSTFHLARNLNVEVGDTLVFQLKGTREQKTGIVNSVLTSPGLMKGWIVVGFEIGKSAV